MLPPEEKTISEDNSKVIKKKKHSVLKFIIAILIIYSIFCLYKFIVLFRIYKIADSFSEENYSMMQTHIINGESVMDSFTKKVGTRIIQETSNPYEKENPIMNENGYIIPYDIEFIDTETKEWYKLHYFDDTKTYSYEDCRNNAATEERLNEILNGEINYIKELTLTGIPSNLGSILLASINPLYQVSLARNEIYLNNFNRMKLRIILTKDCLIENYLMETEFDGTVSFHVSYNYVQEHFKEDITPPLERYRDQIVNLENIKH